MLKQPQQPAIHGADAFAAMRKAGRFTAEVLDFIGVEAAVTKSSTGAAAICGCGGVKSSQW